jgi:hypothetical protein
VEPFSRREAASETSLGDFPAVFYNDFLCEISLSLGPPGGFFICGITHAENENPQKLLETIPRQRQRQTEAAAGGQETPEFSQDYQAETALAGDRHRNRQAWQKVCPNHGTG